MAERLQKILAKAGIASRRKAEELIRAGRVSVDDKIVTELGLKVDPAHAVIAFDGIPVTLEKKIYLLLNKPAGYLTTLSDTHGRPIITDLLHDIAQRVFPVGRLDYDTEGALILTNDGRLSQYIQHPRYEVNKTYEATVTGIPTDKKIRQLEKGIRIDNHLTWPAKVRILERKRTGAIVELIIHEGKKRQVRRMLAAAGCPVKKLKRTAYGNLKMDPLQRGKYRFLSQKDLEKIFSGKIPFTFDKISD